MRKLRNHKGAKSPKTDTIPVQGRLPNLGSIVTW
jgi:hypothetical protein